MVEEGIPVPHSPPPPEDLHPEHSLEQDARELIAARGENDYVAQIARALIGEIGVEELPYKLKLTFVTRSWQEPDERRYIFQNDIRYSLTACYSPLQETYTTYEPDPMYDDSWGQEMLVERTRDLSPVLDAEAIAFFQRHRDTVRTMLPNLATFADMLTQVHIRRMQAIFPHNNTFGMGDITLAAEVDPRLVEDPAELAKLRDFLESDDPMYEGSYADSSSAWEFQDAADVLGKRIQRVEQLYNLWPADVRHLVKEYLSPREAVQLLGGINSFVWQCIEKDPGTGILQNDFYGLMEDSNLNPNMQRFILQHAEDVLSVPFLVRLSQIPTEHMGMLREKIYASLLGSLVTDEHRAKLLTKLGLPPIAVLHRYRLEEYCYKSEVRFQDNMNGNEALVVCYVRPSGKREHVILKFGRTVHLGITLPSEEETEEESWLPPSAILRPLGSVYRRYRDMHAQGVRYLEVSVPEAGPVQEVWTWTRQSEAESRKGDIIGQMRNYIAYQREQAEASIGAHKG